MMAVPAARSRRLAARRHRQLGRGRHPRLPSRVLSERHPSGNNSAVVHPRGRQPGSETPVGKGLPAALAAGPSLSATSTVLSDRESAVVHSPWPVVCRWHWPGGPGIPSPAHDAGPRRSAMRRAGLLSSVLPRDALLSVRASVLPRESHTVRLFASLPSESLSSTDTETFPRAQRLAFCLASAKLSQPLILKCLCVATPDDC